MNRSIVPGETVGQKFWHAVCERGPQVAMRQKVLGIWDEVSWSAYGSHARRIGMGLAALGLEPGDCLSILANTRREWVYCDFGALMSGLVVSGVYPTDSPEQLAFLCSDSRSKVLIVEDDEQLDKALQVRDRLPDLLRIVVMDMEGLRDLKDPQIMSLAALEKLGQSFDEQDSTRFETRLHARRADDVAILVYTSGTTGKPKGAMISHRNLRAVMEQFPVELFQGPDDDKVSFLPLCHIAERMFGSMLSLEHGSRMNFVENPDTVAENVREISPSVMLGVPRVWEKFYSAINLRMKESTPLQRAAYRLALAVGEKHAGYAMAAKPAPWHLVLLNATLRRLVLGNVRRAIGLDRVRWAATGAAPISPDLIRWYWAIGVPLFEVWGMTETTGGGTINLPGALKIGSIGKPQSGMNEIRISEQGEILTRGPNVFLGYLNLPEKTAEAIDAEGWLHTGDVGEMDQDGFVRITDRMKDIIITAGGKNITPSEIENELKFSPYITDAVVVGDRKPFLALLVMIDHENVEQFAQERNIPFSDFASLCRAAEVQALIQSEIDRVNAKFARVEQVKKFRLIE
ncbi:MAG: long-chain fatty acid--CoA ligase, partial [Betaproteobacteria bacterium]|nr:long-chain fatty acid--CoA ligase [Betaproteobacteria bacterium]